MYGGWEKKLLLEWRSGGRRRRGKPTSNWVEEVVEELRRAGVNN